MADRESIETLFWTNHPTTNSGNVPWHLFLENHLDTWSVNTVAACISGLACSAGSLTTPSASEVQPTAANQSTLPPPVTNLCTQNGQVTFEKLVLPGAPPMYRPFLALEEAEEEALKKKKRGSKTDAKKNSDGFCFYLFFYVDVLIPLLGYKLSGWWWYMVLCFRWGQSARDSDQAWKCAAWWWKVLQARYLF